MSEKPTPNDPRIVDALKAVAKVDAVKTLLDHDDQGKPRYRDGYELCPNETVQFTDSNGQYHVVPAKRIDDHFAAAKKAAKTEA